MPPLLMKLLFDRIESTPVPFFLKPVTRRIATQGRDSFVLPQVKRHLGWIESELAQRPWFAGDAFSAADIQMSYPLEAAAQRIGVHDTPKIQDWLHRIHQRPAYLAAQAKGGRFGVPEFPDSPGARQDGAR